MSLKDKIKNAKDVNSEIINIPEWDCELEIRAFTAWVRTSILDKVRTPEGGVDNTMLSRYLLIESVFDPETGEKLFDESDLKWLEMKNGAVIDMIVNKIGQINRWVTRYW